MLLLGRDVDEHEGLAVAPEAVLQEMGQLGVPVWDVGVLLGEGHDDVPEVGQGLVDILGLGQPHPLATTVLDPFAAGKINLKVSFSFVQFTYINRTSSHRSWINVSPSENLNLLRQKLKHVGKIVKFESKCAN